MKTITIKPDGTVEFLGDDPGIDLPLGKIRRRRLSRITPTNSLKKMAFLLIRCLAGDRGRAAAYTRKWKGPWRVVILATGQSAVFDERQACVDWEMEILTGPRFEL